METAEHSYRRVMVETIERLAAQSVLEVGSGAGGFLRSMRGRCKRLVGLDPYEANVAALTREGFEAVRGEGESLPFGDAHFDVVAFSFTPHHIADWPRALNEAWRVARRAVVILDAWYDEAIPSQRVAASYARWSKAIDRACGDVHDDFMSWQTLIAPLMRARDVHFSLSMHLVLQQDNLAEYREHARKQLARVSDATARRGQLDSILADAERDGVSQEGAILVTIQRR